MLLLMLIELHTCCMDKLLRCFDCKLMLRFLFVINESVVTIMNRLLSCDLFTVHLVEGLALDNDLED